MSPSVSSFPSLSMIPSSNPSRSYFPSNSMAPSLVPCRQFSSLAVVGTALLISDEDDGLEIVRLPFEFSWRGLPALNFTHVTVTSNGVMFVGNSTSNGCCSPDAIALDGPYQEEKRIAIAQTDLNPASKGTIYTGVLGDAIVVSWEGVPRFRPHLSTEFGLYFQISLRSCGEIELRWGEGDADPRDQFAAGIQDAEAGIAVPVTGDPFLENLGRTREGTWPRDQCRKFVPDADGNYLEVTGRHGGALPSDNERI